MLSVYSGVMLQATRLEQPNINYNNDLLSPDTIVRLLRTYAHERPRKVPVKLLADLAQTTSKTIYDICRHGVPSQRNVQLLSPVIEAIESRRIYFRVGGWQVCGDTEWVRQQQLVTTRSRRRRKGANSPDVTAGETANIP